MTTYTLCKRLVKSGKLTATILEVFLAAGRITAEEHDELIALVA